MHGEEEEGLVEPQADFEEAIADCPAEFHRYGFLCVWPGATGSIVVIGVGVGVGGVVVIVIVKGLHCRW